MKICSVSLTNLNSLAGKFKLNLEHPELTSAGMFLITGPTGSGKSTLLDAIAYALYGETPRQHSVSISGNEIMSRDFAECRAAVVFEHAGVRYKAITEQKRRNGRTENAAPFAPPSRSLLRWQADGKWAELYNKSREVSAAVADITGMPDVGAFCRCMLLAQGEFSRFLTMGEKERAELLSTITQTEVYASIGTLLHEQTEQAKRDCDSLQSEPTLPAEQRAALEMAAAEQRAQRSALSTERENCRAALRWLSGKAEHEQRVAAAKARLEAARTARAQFAESGKEQKLETALHAAAAEAAEQMRNKALETRRTAEKKLAGTQEALAALTPQLQTAETAHRAAEQESNTRCPQLQTARERVLRELRPAERELNAALARAAEQDKQTARAAKHLKTAETAEQQAAQEWEQLSAARTEQQRALESLKPYAELAPAMADIKAAQRAWELCTADPAAVPPATAEAEAQLIALRGELERVSAGQSPAQLAERAAALIRVQEAAELLNRHRRDAETAQQERQTAQTRAAEAAAPLAEAEQQTEHLRRAEKKYAELADMQEVLDECYRKFCEGEYSVCPCCGSATPGEHRPVAEGELHRVRLAREQAERSLRALQKQQAAAQTALAKAAAACDSHAAAVQSGTAALERALNALGLPAVPADLPQLIAAAQQAAKRTEELVRRAETAEKQRTAARARDELHRTVRPFTQELPATCGEAAPLVRLFDRYAAKYTRLTGELQQAAVRAEEKSRTLAAAKTARTAAAEEHARVAAESAALRADCEQRQRALREQWNGQSADALEQQYAAQEKALNTALQSALCRLNDLRRSAASLTTAQTEQQEQLQQAEHALAEAAVRLNNLLAEQGFADEAAYQAAKLPSDARAALQAEKKALEDSLLTATAAAETVEHALQQHLAAPHTEETAEALNARHAELAAKDAELETKLTAVLADLRTDDERLARNRSTAARKAELQAVFERWKLLKEILGDSKDGFQKYAQSITFDALIASANRQLQHLFPRFILTQDRSKGALNLGVTDLWLDDTTARNVSNLSGGETFIVSLALALGLSGLSNSRVSIDTLFLDEGFGTLDPDNLSHVLTALEQLQLDGKLIGIITHVESLKNSFPPACNIQVEKLGNSGYSTLKENPAVEAAPAAASARGTTPTRRRRTRSAAPTES